MVYWYRTPDNVEPAFGAWSNRIKWCEKYCQGVWKYKTQGRFVFCDEKDYTLFLLRWA
jgi:hypothetical protein